MSYNNEPSHRAEAWRTSWRWGLGAGPEENKRGDELVRRGEGEHRSCLESEAAAAAALWWRRGARVGDVNRGERWWGDKIGVFFSCLAACWLRDIWTEVDTGRLSFVGRWEVCLTQHISTFVARYALL